MTRRAGTGRKFTALALGSFFLAAACSSGDEALGVAEVAVAENSDDASIDEVAADEPAEATRPSRDEVASALAKGILGTDAADVLTSDDVDCIAGVMVDGNLPDHVLVAFVNDTPLSAAENESAGLAAEAATIACVN